MARHIPAAGRRRGGRILLGLAALAVLAALLIAVPLVLLAAWRVLGPPAPTWQELTSPDDGTLFVRMLCLIGWAGWITFAWSVLAEMLAQILGWRLPALPWQRRVAAGLLAAITLTPSSPAIAGRAAMPVHTAPVVTAPASPAPPVPAPTASPADAAARHLHHRVQPGEQMPGLAERYLGDKYQWHAIAAATYGMPQPDGHTLRPGDTRVYPGWTVRIPAQTAALIPAAHATTAHRVSGPTYQITRGDWLWHIAGRFLGDPERYPEIEALNPGLEHRDGRFPDHIEAGWRLVLPTDARDRGPRVHAAGQLVTTAPADPTTAQPGGSGPGSGGPATPAGPTATATPTPAAAATPSPSVTASASTATAPPPSNAASPTPTPSDASPTASHAPDEDPDHSGVVIVSTLAGAGLLAALILSAVVHRRRRQQQHRRRGRRLPQPRGGITERDLRVAEQPADVDRLDTALRHLAAGLADRDQSTLPDIFGAWLTGGDVQILLGQPCEGPPAPWQDEGHQWTLPGHAPLPDVSEHVPPLPTLATVGSQAGRHLLLDLERLGALSITGDPGRAAALLRYLGSELACNSWSEDIEIILAGFPTAESELLIALNPDRVRAVSSVTEAADRLRRRVATAKATLGHVGAADALAGRIRDLAGDSWMPHVLLAADPDADALAALRDLDADLNAAGRCAVAVAATTPTGCVGQAVVTVTDDGILHVALPNLHTSTAAAGLPTGELEPLAEIMRQARTAADAPTPPAPEVEPWAHGTDAAGGILALFDTDDATSASPPGDDTAPVDDNTAATDHDRETRQPTPTTDTAEPPAEPSPGLPATVPSIAAPTRQQVTAAVRQRRRQADPHLDDDLKAWQTPDLTRPRVAILGPVDIAAPGETPEQRQRFHAEVIVYLAARSARGADRHQLEDALWPDRQVKDGALRTAISRARRWLGEQPNGHPWLPDMSAERTYRLADGVLFDWHLFRRLRTRGEAYGPAGVGDLRVALEFVRGVPLDGADRAYAAGSRNPFTWLPESDIFPPHIVSAIVDTAHQLAGLYLDAGDTTGARWAVHRAWLADPYRGDDEPWHDIMRVEHIDGHTAELRHLLAELMRVRDAEVPEDLQPATYELLRTLLPELIHPTSGAPVAR